MGSVVRMILESTALLAVVKDVVSDIAGFHFVCRCWGVCEERANQFFVVFLHSALIMRLSVVHALSGIIWSELFTERRTVAAV